MPVPLLTADQIRQTIPALHRQGSGFVVLTELYAIGLAYDVIRVFERRTGGRVVATLGTLATDAWAILTTLEHLGQVWPDGATEKPLWKVVDDRGQRLGVFVDEKIADGFTKGWIFQQARPGLTNPDFGLHAAVMALAEEDYAELADAPERQPAILTERTP